MKVFDSCEVPGGLILSEDIDDTISKMMSKQLENDDKRETHEKFNTVNSNSYYSLFNNNKQYLEMS